MTAAESAERAQNYDPRAIQDKWQARWAEMDLFRASDDPDDARPRTYLLDMFPYPSGDLHMGHAEAYAIADAVARYYFQRHHNVLHPIGWDAFPATLMLKAGPPNRNSGERRAPLSRGDSASVNRPAGSTRPITDFPCSATVKSPARTTPSARPTPSVVHPGATRCVKSATTEKSREFAAARSAPSRLYSAASACQAWPMSFLSRSARLRICHG